MLATAMLVLAWAWTAPSSAEVQRAVRHALDQPGYQRRLPSDAPAPGAPRPAGRGAPSRETPRVPGVPTALVWLVFVGIGAALVLWAWREFARATSTAASVTAESRPDDAHAPAPRSARRGASAPWADDAERLAAEGRFGEAIHALLLLALARLAPAPALTAREVLRQAGVRDDARLALGALVSESERVSFAGGAAGAAEFERSREHWRRFAASFQAARA